MKKIKTRLELEERMSLALTEGSALELLTAEFNKKEAALIEKTREEIVELKDEYDDIIASIEDFASENKNNADYFGESRTINLLAGSISWKKGKQTVDVASGFDEDTFPKLARKFNLEEVIRTPKEELDKNAVIRLYNSGELTDDQLRKLGISIDAEDGLTIKFKKIDKKKVGA